MSSINRTSARLPSFAAPYAMNHNGLKVKAIKPEDQLTRLTMANMLWEKQFYMDGKDSAELMESLIPKVSPDFVAVLAKAARTEFKLRHAPLLLMRALAKNKTLGANDLADVIQRPDEMGEFLAMYRKDNKKEPISNQVKKGLAKAFGKFNEYQLAKWDKNSAQFKLRDVMFLVHPKPENETQAQLFSKIANKQLETPDTWETELSAGSDKRMTFTRLMAENKLGALAFLRNLRNMEQSGVSSSEIRAYGAKVNVDRVLPFRFIAAARVVPKYEDMLEQMMFRATAGMPKLPGKTVLMVDCSGSMYGTKVSAKSDLDRFDAAAALAVLCREVCEEVEIFGFADTAVAVAPRRGFALVQAIRDSTGGGTDLGRSMLQVNKAVGKYDRIIVITDEQSSTKPTKRPEAKGYILDVASYQNGLNLDDWVTITGFSEACLSYIQMAESLS